MDESKLKPWQHDVAVLFLFFTREKQTAAVFEQIKAARPRKLFLYQDGPRAGRSDDIENIAKCRNIVEDIDWDCEVYRMYQELNYGCDPSEFISQKWMFSHVDKGIVLEDDDVPSQSFFPYCKELLDRYEYDTRINIICGMNNIDGFDNGYSYLFSRYGSIWGWASWKRVVDQWDPEYKWMEDPHLCEVLSKLYKNFDSWLNVCRSHKASGKEHYESILAGYARTNNTLNIVPCRNLITNIGITSESTHSVSDICKLPRSIRRVFNMRRHEISFPLKNPPYVVCDRLFDEKFEKLMVKNRFVRFFQKVESRLYHLIPFLGK